MIITNCPRCGAMNVTTTCTKCGWSQFTKSTVSTGTIVDESAINTRPIEDELRKRIAELEAERLELRKTLGWAYDLDEYKDNPEERER